MKTRKRLAASAFAMLAVVGMVAACTPPDSSGKPPKVDWSFRGTQVKVHESQDAVFFGLINNKDEPFLLNVAFRVTIGKKDSAKAWVVNNRTAAPQNIGEGTTVAVSNEAGGKVVFDGVRPVDVLDLVNNKLEIVGTYTWAAEQDDTTLQAGAQLVADLLEGALNTTIANTNLAAGVDANALAQDILDLLVTTLFDWDGISGAFSLAWKALTSSSFSFLGDTSDDALGGGLFIGIGARGTLASALDGLIGNNPALPPVEIPLLAVPPSIQAYGLYTMNGKTEFNKTFTGPKPKNIFDITTPNVDGKHQWWMTAEKNAA